MTEIFMFRNTLRVPVTYSRRLPDLPANMDGKKKNFIVPVSPFYVNMLRPYRRVMDDRAIKACDQLDKDFIQHKKNLTNLAKSSNIDFSHIKAPYKPYNHQAEVINAIWDTLYAAIFADCGTGKTPMFIWFVELLRLLGKPYKALVVCPKSLIKQAWQHDILKLSNDMNGTNLHYKRQSRDNPIHILNYESISSKYDKLLEQKYDLIILDESSKAKNSESQRTKAVTKLAHTIERRYILSGSPAPNGPIDLWSQFYLLDKGMTLGPDLPDFRRRTHTFKDFGNRQPLEWTVTDAGASMIRKAIAPMILRYKLEDCVDLPPQIPVKRKINLSAEQRIAYDELAEEMVTTVDGIVVEAPYTVVQMQKFCQITGGWIIDNDKEVHAFKSNPKMDAVLEYLEEIGKRKVVIWTWYQHQNHGITKVLRDQGYKVSQAFSDNFAIDGTKRKLDYVIDEWREHGEILVANHDSLGYGQTFNEAKYLLYYDNSFSFDHRYQTSRRNLRIGQTEKTVICDFVARNTIDVKLLRSLASKEAMQEYLINPEI